MKNVLCDVNLNWFELDSKVCKCCGLGIPISKPNSNNSEFVKARDDILE